MQTHLRSLTLLLLTLLPLPTPAAPEPVASVEGISEYRLDNGLRLLLYRENSRPTVTVNLTVLVGSRHEGYGETGMAHLLEHMLFKGTENHPKIFQLLTSRGAQFNGSTSDDRTNYFETLPATDDNLDFMLAMEDDRTNYFETLPATDDNLDFMLAMEADRLINCPIRAEELASEMTVVRNEFERGENSPTRILYQRMFASAFEWHNYGKSTIGNRSDIEKVPVDSLRRFYKKYYQPDNAVVIVAGRFDPSKALDLAQKYFGAIPRPDRKLEHPYTEEPPQDGERLVTLRRVGDVPAVGLLYHIPAGPDPEFAAVDVLARVLADQPAGVLYKALVETNKATSVSASADPQHDPGALTIFAQVRPDQSPESVRDAALAAIDAFIEKGTTPEDVARVQQRFLKGRERLLANTSQLAVNLSEWASQGDWRLFFLHRDRVAKVTPDDVKAVAARYLRRANRTVGLFTPTKAPERVAVAPAPDVAAMVKDYKGNTALAAGEDFDPSPANIESRTRLGTLASPDLKTAFLPKKTRGQTVNLRLTLRYGDANSLKNLVAAADLLPDVMARATKSLSRQQLADALDKASTTLGAAGGPGQITFTLQTKRDHLPAALDLLRQVLREPALPESELDILKRRALAAIEQNRTDPTALVTNTIARKLNPHPADDVRYTPTFDEQLARYRAVTIDQLRAVYQQLGATHGELVVVGDFDEDTVKSALTQTLANWSSPTPYQRIKHDAPPTLARADESIKTPDRANAQYGAAFAFPIPDTHADYPALVMANRILGGGGNSRLWVRVRETEGLSYGVRSSFSASPLDPTAELQISAIVNPTNMPKLKTTIQEELTKLLETGVSLDELNRAKASYLDQQLVARSQDPTLAGILATDLHANRTIRHQADLDQKIRTLTPDQVTDAAKKYLNPNHLITITAGDFPDPK